VLMLEKTQRSINSYSLYRLGDQTRRRAKRNKVLEYLGGKCVNCGNTDLEVLEGDHLNQDRKLWQITDLLKMYRMGILETIKIQLLCCNCHRKKSSMHITLVALEKAGIPPF